MVVGLQYDPFSDDEDDAVFSDDGEEALGQALGSGGNQVSTDYCSRLLLDSCSPLPSVCLPVCPQEAWLTVALGCLQGAPGSPKTQKFRKLLGDKLDALQGASSMCRVIWLGVHCRKSAVCLFFFSAFLTMVVLYRGLGGMA